MKFTFRFSFFLFFLLISLKSFSQDVIILKNGDEIQSKVVEVSTDMIKYKKWDNQDGPMYSSTKAEVFMIKYQNGTKDVFNATQLQVNITPVDNSSKVIGIAKPFMDKQISTESKGACKMVEFYKQNGVEKDIFGQKIYTLEYRLIIELQRDFWKESKDKWLGANWYWGNFNVLEKKGDVYAEQFTNNYTYFTKGTMIEITGKIDFESTDNGWRMTGVNMFSYGYENKTSRVLTNVVNTTPVKPKQDELKKPIEEKKGVYTGDYKAEKRDGHGRMIYEDGSSYEGEWKDDKRNGQGKYTSPYGISYYEGEWRDDMENGFGTKAFPGAGGEKFVGNYVDGKLNGKAIFYRANGEKGYEGEYFNNIRHGYGTFTSIASDGTKVSYVGEWRDDVKNGQGTSTVILTNGESSVFIGELKDGKYYNGTQTMIKLNGNKYIILYTNGKKGKEKKEK